MRKVTEKEWLESKTDFSKFISGKDYPDNYEATLFKNMVEPIEVDEEIYMYFMECLPPIGIKNGFQNSEAVCWGTFNTFTKHGNRYFYHGHGPRGGDWVKTPDIPIYEKKATDNGECYRNETAFIEKTGVCYIPDLSDQEYTYADFLRIATEAVKEYAEDNEKRKYTPETLAVALFNWCDWQHPESVIPEIMQGDSNAEETQNN